MPTTPPTASRLTPRQAHREILSWMSVDWRWCRAWELFQARLRPIRLDDSWTWKAWRYLRDLSRCQNEAERRTVIRRNADLHTACRIYRADDWRRMALEARLLSGLPPADIARRSDLSEATVRTYEAVFFDWRRGRNAPIWILANVIRPPLRRSTGCPVHKVVRRHAYFGGPLVAETLIAVALKDAGIVSKTGLPADIERQCRRLIELETMPINERTFPAILRRSQRMAVAEARMSDEVAMPTLPATNLSLELPTLLQRAVYDESPTRSRRLVSGPSGQQEAA